MSSTQFIKTEFSEDDCQQVTKRRHDEHLEPNKKVKTEKDQDSTDDDKLLVKTELQSQCAQTSLKEEKPGETSGQTNSGGIEEKEGNETKQRKKMWEFKKVISENFRDEYGQSIRTYRCEICHMVEHDKCKFVQEHVIKQHESEEEKRKWRVTCEICGENVFSFDLNDHNLTAHKEDPSRRCDKCNKNFPTKYGLLEHNRIIHKQASEKCPLCAGSLFSTHKDLQKHQKRKHGVKKRFPCDQCSLDFRTKYERRSHKRSQHGGQTANDQDDLDD